MALVQLQSHPFRPLRQATGPSCSALFERGVPIGGMLVGKPPGWLTESAAARAGRRGRQAGASECQMPVPPVKSAYRGGSRRTWLCHWLCHLATRTTACGPPPVASERTIDSCPGKFPGRETPRQPVTSGAFATCARRTAPCGAAGGGGGV